MMRKNKLILSLFLLVYTILLVGCSSFSKEDALVSEISYSQKVFELNNSMADTYSQYLAYNMEDDKFKKEIESYINKYKDNQNEYLKYREKHEKLYQEKDTLKKVSDSLEKAKGCIYALLSTSIQDGKVISREALYLTYLEKMEEGKTYLDEFKKEINVGLE